MHDRYNDLKRLKDLASAACQVAFENKASADYEKDPVNWADLECVDARYYQAFDGSEGYEVLIEEAAPDSWQLSVFIGNYLKENGFPNVDVRTEW